MIFIYFLRKSARIILNRVVSFEYSITVKQDLSFLQNSRWFCYCSKLSSKDPILFTESKNLYLNRFYHLPVPIPQSCTLCMLPFSVQRVNMWRARARTHWCIWFGSQCDISNHLSLFWTTTFTLGLDFNDSIL